MKKIIGAVVVICIALVVVFIWKPFGKADAGKGGPAKPSTSIVARGNLTISVSATGIVQPNMTVDLKSKASGEIIEFPLEEGAIVTKGELIARLDASTAQNDFDQARADLAVATIAQEQSIRQAERQKQLYDQKLISELDYDNAILAREQSNSNLVKSKATLQNSKERLDECEVRSPIDGIILKKFVEEGQIIASGISAVSGGTTIATIADMSTAYIDASVDEVDIGQVKIGQKATIVAESYPDREFPGEIVQIHPLAQTQQNVTTFLVTTEVDNSEGLLMAGMDVNAEIIAAQKENVLLVPREALTDAKSLARMTGGSMAQRGGPRGPDGLPPTSPGRAAPGNATMRQARAISGADGDSTAVNKAGSPEKIIIIVKNGKQEPKPVELGLSNFEQVEILSGIEEGDTILATINSKALQDREEMLQRMREWNHIPGMERRGR